MAMAESPATALRRYQTDLRKLIRGGFNRYADCKKCWVVWTDDGRDALTDAANAAIVGDVIAVSEDNNLVLPREFGLLTKQAVYLNRYVTTLAPDLDVFEGDLLGAGGAVEGAPEPAAPAAPE